MQVTLAPWIQQLRSKLTRHTLAMTELMKWDLTFFFLFMTISISSLSLMKKKELISYFHYERPISLNHFKTALKSVSKTDKDYLAFWYGLISGNTQSLSKDYKQKYKAIGLSHAFTPSGFHLSAVLTPLTLILPKKSKLPLNLLVCFLVFLLPGLEPLKRMGLVKVFKLKMNARLSLMFAGLICLILGQLNHSPLSFIFSFFFLGVIYSGLKNIALIIWFFIGQLLICFFQGEQLSLINLVISPLANFFLGLITPLLFVFSYPLWSWTLQTGIIVIKSFDQIATVLYQFSSMTPQLEVHCFTVLLVTLMLLRKKKSFILGVLLFSTSLNLENPSKLTIERYYFEPTGHIIKQQIEDGIVKTYYRDGRCVEKIVMGRWEKRCSPKRAPKIRKIKKLSYL